MNQFQEKLLDNVKVRVLEVEEKITSNFRAMDTKMVQLRKDTDVDTFMRMITKKADNETVNSDLKNHEFKIGILDTNVMRMAADQEVFQKAMNKMNLSVIELYEANGDVLLGTRKLNCLSCGNDSSDPVGHGIDGRVYKSITPMSK